MTTEAGWKYLGLLAKARRDYIGLNQEDLAQYGGPAKTTVGKIENARMRALPPRTQQHLEKALGWRRGAVRDILSEPEESWWEPAVLEEGYDLQRFASAVDYIEADLPDLTRDEPAKSARHLTDEELLAELTYRMRAYSADSATLGQIKEGSSEEHGTSMNAAEKGVAAAERNVLGEQGIPDADRPESGDSEGDSASA